MQHTPPSTQHLLSMQVFIGWGLLNENATQPGVAQHRSEQVERVALEGSWTDPKSELYRAWVGGSKVGLQGPGDAVAGSKAKVPVTRNRNGYIQCLGEYVVKLGPAVGKTNEV